MSITLCQILCLVKTAKHTARAWTDLGIARGARREAQERDGRLRFPGLERVLDVGRVTPALFDERLDGRGRGGWREMAVEEHKTVLGDVARLHGGERDLEVARVCDDQR